MGRCPPDLRQAHRPWSCAIVRKDEHYGKVLEELPFGRTLPPSLLAAANELIE
jgi:hypothetical protein